MDAKDPHIRSQDSAHRRGLVLGLTMAEIIVLILFTLLLALAAVQASREKIIQDKERRITELVVFEKQVGDLLRNNPQGVTVQDIIQRINRQERRIAEQQREIDRLKPYEASGKALEDIIREIRRTGDDKVTSQQIVEKLQWAAQLTRDNDNLKGQVAQLTNQIKALGRGNELPSCWATPNGKIESIFELVIMANGIGIKDRDLPHRAEDKAKLPLAGVQYDIELPLSTFQNQVRPLYQWSVDNRCRFYVIIFSSVASAPIQLVNAVNSFFYPDSRIQYRPGAL